MPPHRLDAPYHTHLTAFFPGHPVKTTTRKMGPFWILMKQAVAIARPYADHLQLTADK